MPAGYRLSVSVIKALGGRYAALNRLLLGWNAYVKDPYRIWADQVLLRFTMESDNAAEPGEGWMIDELMILIQECPGSVDELSPNQFISQVTPNPVESGILRISFDEELNEKISLKIFDYSGRMVLNLSEQVYQSSIEVKNSLLSAGSYIYRIEAASGKFSTGRFILMK